LLIVKSIFIFQKSSISQNHKIIKQFQVN